MDHNNCTLRVRGVALIVRNPLDQILIVQEMQTKPQYGKYAGMSSPPMETSGDRERDYSALYRLLDEEMPTFRDKVSIEAQRCGVYRIVPHVWVSLYVARIDSTCLPTPTARSREEVAGYTWMPPQAALTLWLRQGAREMINDYVADNRRVVRLSCQTPAILQMRRTA